MNSAFLTLIGLSCFYLGYKFYSNYISEKIYTLNDKQKTPLRAWTLVTALNDLSDFQESIGEKRPKGESYSKDFKGPNWLDQRNTAIAYLDRDPTVVVVGGGQAGLSIAARLGQMKVDTLIVDREQRIGDNWRKRRFIFIFIW